MTRFASPLLYFPDYAGAVRRPVSAVAPVREGGESPDSKALAGMLLAAVLAALLVVADQLIDIWVDGHLLAGWVALWTVTFAALAVLAPPLRHWAGATAALIARRVQAAKQRSMEEQMWEHARHDPRVMAELQTAWVRSHSDA